MSLQTFRWFGLVGAVLALGCFGTADSDTGESTGPGASDVAEAVPAPTPDDPEAVAAFADAKNVVIEKNEHGNVVHLDLLKSRRYADKLSLLPKLSQLQYLGMGGPDVDDEIMDFVAQLKDLKVLNLGDRSKVTDAGVERLLQLEKLEDVNLRRSDILDDAIKHLAQLPSLKRLRITQTNVGDGGMAHLKNCPNLELLDVQDCKLITDAGISHLAGLTRMRSLRIYGSNITDTSMTYLADMKELRSLSMDQSGVSSAGLAHIAGLIKLTDLKLYGVEQVDDTGMDHVAKLENLTNLRLRATTVGDAGLAKLAPLKKLKSLDLSENRLVTNEGMKSLGAMSSLEDINLWSTEIDDEGVALLAGLKGLRRLNLNKTYVSDASMDIVAGFENLEFLHIGSAGGGISDAGLAKLHGLKYLKHVIMTFLPMVSEAGYEALKKALPEGATIEADF